MGIKLNTALKALTMLLVCNFCRSSNETLQIDTLFLLDRKEINHNFEFKDIDRNSIEDLIFQRIEKRSLNYTKDDKDLVNIESNYTDLVSKMKKGKVSSNNSEIHFGKILSFEEDDSSYVDAYNFTEEPCVGDPEFCNMTRDEYLDMLNDYIFPQPYEWVLITAHAIVFVIGLIGNALVCIAVYRNHSMRTVTNYFIVNLAVADFMVILICLPPTVLWDVTETWFFGTAMCRIVLYFQSVSVTVSVLTLTFISVDRWYAICFPLRFKSTTGRAKTAILIIWCLSLTFNIPEFVVLQVQRKMQLRFNVQYFMQCTSTWSGDSDLKWHIIKALFLYTFHSTSRMLTIPRRDDLLLYQVIVLFSLGVSFSLARLYLKTSFVFLPRPIDTTYNSRFPLFLMMVAYCQIVRVLWRSDNIPGHTESHKLCNPPTGTNNWLAANRRATPSIHANASTEGQLRSRRKAAKMLVAVVVMFAVCYFPVHLLSVLRLAYDVQQSDIMTCIALISHVMCYANSAVNPLIYNFMSGKFRREFHKSYFKCFCCCHPAASQDQNRTSFAPIGSSRAGTTRTIVRRNDSCVSYRLTHLSPSNQNNIYRDYARNTNTSFIENLNGNKRPKKGDDSLSESATRFTIATDAGKE